MRSKLYTKQVVALDDRFFISLGLVNVNKANCVGLLSLGEHLCRFKVSFECLLIILSLFFPEPY